MTGEELIAIQDLKKRIYEAFPKNNNDNILIIMGDFKTGKCDILSKGDADNFVSLFVTFAKEEPVFKDILITACSHLVD